MNHASDTRPAMRPIVLGALLLALGPAALAQPPALPTPAPAKPAPAQPVSVQSLPPTLRLGARVNLVERQFAVIPTVVIVPDEASFLAAIAKWQTTATGAIRFPILIDNGTWAARTHIARFVHAFSPKSVLRWSASGEIAKLPDAPDVRQRFIENAAAAAWGATTAADLKKQWDALGFAPPGVVVCSLKDPAWTAAVALAAGHGQPIIWIDPPPFGDPPTYIMPEYADAMAASIATGLDALPYKWNALGDDIDAVTLCMTTPSKVWLGQKDLRRYFALTDWIGRSDAGHKRERWAWCAQIIGDAPRAVFDAMSALFLQPANAWLFDGYDSSEPWIQFDMTKAASELGRIGIKSMLDDGPSGRTPSDLQSRATGIRQSASIPPSDAGMGIDAGLIAFNSKGNSDFFTLGAADARPIDIPILRRPAMVYFVHSFSAAMPMYRTTVGGMWIDRGAYAYLGSTDEPYLQAFVPTPVAMARLAAGIPWGAVGRTDGGEIWKLAVHGDPLITFGPHALRTSSAAVPLADTSDAAGKLPEQLKQRDFESAMWTLALTGRDREAARLLAALAKDDPAACTPAVALAGIPSAFYTGDYATLLLGAAKAAPALADESSVKREGLDELRDMFWHALTPSLGRPTAEEADLLPLFLRPDAFGHDTNAAERAAESIHGAGAGRAIRDKADAIQHKRSAPPPPALPPSPSSVRPKGK